MFGRDTKSVEQLYEKQKEKEMLEDQDASVYSVIFWYREVTKIVYFIGNEHMLIAHDSNRLRFS